MSQFGAANSALIPAQLAALVTDPDLAASSAALLSAFESAIAPKASQASVDNLGATLGPAIVNATADKATSVQVSASKAELLAGQTAARDAILNVQATAVGLTSAKDVLLTDAHTTRDTLAAGQATMQAGVIAALAPRTGQVVEMSADTPMPAGHAQISGPPLTLPGAPLALRLLDWAGPNGNARFVVCADGLHYFYANSTSVLTGSQGHLVFNETGGFFGSVPAILGSIKSSIGQITGCALADGNLLVFGGCHAAADNLVVTKYDVVTKLSSQVADVPAGGWTGGFATLLNDGRICWLPSHWRSTGATLIANPDKWLYYSPAPVNAWTLETAAFPQGILQAASAGSGGSVGTALRLPSGKLAVVGATSSSDWYLVDPVAKTWAGKARPSVMTHVTALETATGWAYAGISFSDTVQFYTEAIDSWATVTSYRGCRMSASNLDPFTAWKAYRLLSGSYLQTGTTPTALMLGDYLPTGTYKAKKL